VNTQCPHCFTVLDAAASAFRCIGSCGPVRDEVASTSRGHPVSERPAFTVAHPAAPAPGYAFCPTCHTRSNVALCPRCHGALPGEWRSYATTCIALAGARYSGKSVYIGVLVRQLRWLATEMGTVLSPVTRDTERVYKQRYERALFEQREIVPGTPSQLTQAHEPEPLIYHLTPPGLPRHALVIRDVAGEDLQTVEGLDPQVFGFFGRAHGILFLVDPMQVRAIREQLAGKHSWGGAPGDDPLLVLHNITELRRRSTGVAPVRLALTLAKFDVLHTLATVAGSQLQDAMQHVGAAFLRDPSMESAAYDVRDGRLLDAELRSLLVVINGAALLNLSRRDYPELRCFAVSALGHHPKAERLGRTGITPFRCLDPVKWFLSTRGVLPAMEPADA
jgi:Double-GTPase 2